MFVAGWNIPGFLPNYVEEFDTFENARLYLIGALEQEKESDLREEDEYEIYNSAISDEVKSWRKREFNETLLMPNGYVYFIHEFEFERITLND